MHQGRIVFAQLMQHLPRHDFNQCVARYQGNQGIRHLSCYDQFIAMAFAQLTGRDSFRDAETGKRLTFLTSNFLLPAEVIAKLYQKRWQVELFFKWIKQHLRIQAFFGTTENAVKTQIWIAISVYVLVAIVRKQLRVETSLYTILQVLSITLFEKTPILQAFSATADSEESVQSPMQLNLFNI